MLRRFCDLFGLVWGSVSLPRSFQPIALEEGFLAEHARNSMVPRRAASILMFSVYVIYGANDAPVSVTQPSWLTVQVVSAAILAAGSVVTFLTWFRRPRFAELWSVLLALACFVALFRLQPDSRALGQAGIAFISNVIYLMFICTMFRLRAAMVLLLLSAGFVSSLITLSQDGLGPNTLLQSGHITPSVIGLLLATVAYQVAFVLVGYVTVVALERGARAAFFRQRQLAQANEELVAARLEISRTSQALLTAQEALRYEAEQRNFAKSRFLADAAHDLSQPMHAVNLLVESARHALAREDPAKGAALLEKAAQAALTASASFSAVLEISQLESGQVRLVYTTFEIDMLVEEVIAPLRAVADAHGVRLRVRRSALGPLQVHSDRTLLGRAIGNLVSNAIKYADPAKGSRKTVLLGITRIADRVRIDVVDNGIGIAAQHQQEIFKPLVQLVNPDRNRDRGIGLGLSIVKAVADLLDGHTVNLSSSEQRGSRFSIMVPRREDRLATLGVDLGQPGVRGDLSSLFVWCVEDDPIARDATTALLDEFGVLYEQAAAVAELEQALPLHERKPDLIITDYRLETGRTGEDVLAALSNHWGQDFRCLVLTGEVLAPEHVMARRPRTLILRKPATAAQILQAINSLCFET